MKLTADPQILLSIVITLLVSLAPTMVSAQFDQQTEVIELTCDNQPHIEAHQHHPDSAEHCSSCSAPLIGMNFSFVLTKEPETLPLLVIQKQNILLSRPYKPPID